MSTQLTPQQRAALRGRVERAREHASADVIPRRSDSGPAQLSFAQQRLWFLDQLAPGNPFYNIPAALPLRVAVSETALRSALGEIVRRHEALRTVFISTPHGPRQQVVGAYDPLLPTIDLASHGSGQRQPQLEKLATEEARGAFDLTRGPLLRARLVRLGPADFVLLLTLHHIVADGWSIGVLFRELMQLYAAFRQGVSATLPALPIQYADYAVWQRRTLCDSRLEALLRYWRRQLAGLPTLTLVTDRPRPPVATFRGAFLDVAFDAELTSGVEALARRHDATLFQTLLAAFKCVLARYAGQTDIVVGAPIANRTRPEIEGLIGFFVNSVVLRTDLSGDPTFAEIVARVRSATIAAYEHQELPFERLVEELQPQRDMSRNPLVQVTFQIQNAPGAQREKPEGLDLPVRIERATAIFDLAFSLWETKQGLVGGVEYSTDIFDEATVQRLMESLRCVLRCIVGDEKRRLSGLPLLTPEQRSKQMLLLQGESVDVADYDLFASFRARVQADPQAVVILDDAGTLTRAELLDEAEQVSRGLRKRGVGDGDIVALRMHRGRAFVAAMLGVLETGAAWMPIDPASPPARNNQLLQLARPRLILGESGGMEDWPESGKVPSLPGRDRPAYVLFTSGSTGKPKGVVVSHHAVANHMAWMRGMLPLTSRGSRVIQRTPLHFDAAVWELWAPLMGDGVMVIPPPFEAADTGQLCAAIDRLGASILQIVPSLLQLLLDDPLAERCRTLRRLCVGGEALSAELLMKARERWPGIEIVNLYGPTEATIDATWWVVDPQWSFAAPVPIGRPIWNSRISIRDAAGEIVPCGVIGEICIAGAGLANGYLGAAESDGARFVEDADGSRYYRSGDFGWARRDGLLFCAGRGDQQVKIRGNRVELGEVEAAVATHPSVHATVVIATADAAQALELQAFVVVDPQAPLVGQQDLRTLERAHVDEWHELYEAIYDPRGQSAERVDFDTVGWISSYDGRPIAAPAMREWHASTLSRVTALRPRRVVEIGCGAGLILHELAPRCQRYVACDFSLPAIERAKHGLPADCAVRFEQCAAHEIAKIGERGFDLAVLNSVVQYFPGLPYLMEVLDLVRTLLTPGGRVFIGDVRHYGLMNAFHADVQDVRAPANLRCDELRERLRFALAHEKELLIDPLVFWQRTASLQEFGRVAVRLKRGRSASEMLAFRYDVLLEVGAVAPAPTLQWHDWQRAGFDLPTLDARLRQGHEPFGIVGIPNARVQRAVRLNAALANACDSEPVHALRAGLQRGDEIAIDPESLAATCEAAQWQAELLPSPERADEFAVVVHRGSLTAFEADAALLARCPCARGRMASNPLLATIGPGLERDLRSYLAERLPSPMIPARIEPLAKFPLLANGKVDRAALALLAEPRARPVPGALAKAADALESLLAEIWAGVLRLKRVGAEDHFFNDLGGHSLLATQVVSRVREALQIELPLRLLFEHCTVRSFAAALIALPQGGSNLVEIAQLVREIGSLDAAALDEQLGVQGGCG